MAVEYDERTGMFAIRLTRSGAIDVSVFFGVRAVARAINDGLYGDELKMVRQDIIKLLDEHPEMDACHWCLHAITYVEGEWRHTETCRSRCSHMSYTATPRRDVQ